LPSKEGDVERQGAGHRSLDLVTDGDKEAPRAATWSLTWRAWVQIDLARAVEIWRWCSGISTASRGVSRRGDPDLDDPDFIQNVKTCSATTTTTMPVSASARTSNTSRPTTAVDRRQGRQGRYVRLYSNGNTSNQMNHYTEVEVSGSKRPKIRRRAV